MPGFDAGIMRVIAWDSSPLVTMWGEANVDVNPGISDNTFVATMQ